MITIAELRRRYPLLAVLPETAITTWFQTAVTRSVGIGETLFASGSPGQSLFVVQTGRIRILKPARLLREVVLGSVEPGELVGEYALLAPGLNTASCRAAEHSSVLQLPLKPLQEIIQQVPEVNNNLKRWLRLHAIISHLKEKAFLGFISASSLMPFIEKLETLKFPSGMSIQTDGLTTNRWFYISRGQAKIEFESGRSEILKVGDSFGEHALLNGKINASVDAATDVSCLSITRDAFLEKPPGAMVESFQSLPISPHERVKSFPWIAQQDATDCGIASLWMILRYHGKTIEPNEIRGKILMSDRGCNLSELQSTATKLGFHSQAIRVGKDQLDQIQLPAIAHLADDHYVVLYAWELNQVIIGDPAIGIRTLSRVAFTSIWTGHLLLVRLNCS